MHPVAKPRWQHMTALVSLTAGGAITGFSFAPGTVPDLTSPTGMPISLMAMRETVRPAQPSDATLRSAIVNVADYYLRMAKDRTPAEMQAIIWQNDSTDGADHGQSCAAFASLTLELAAQVVGRQSWVTGGTSYPWPLQKWADVRVDPNPASTGVISIRQDAQAHHRWHPLGDGYEPLPGDWVLFNGHVEVVRKYAAGVLYTIGGDSLPNFSVNAHEYRDPLGAQGIAGFVNNGQLPGAAGSAQPSQQHIPSGHPAGEHSRGRPHDPSRNGKVLGLAAIPGASAAGHAKPAAARLPGRAATTATPAAGSDSAVGGGHRPDGRAPGGHVSSTADRGDGVDAGVPGADAAALAAAAPPDGKPGAAAIPGLSLTSHHRDADSPGAGTASPYRRHHPEPAAMPLSDANAQQSFIGTIAPGAIAAQRKYGVPAAVTIAQAIDESGWGQSSLATEYHNLFGIKGTGPAGGALLPAQEYENGHSVTRSASFRVYHNTAQSINDHGKLIATSGYYKQAMADRNDPNAFAAALTGVYATDPEYGAKLIGIMRRYDLYRYDGTDPARASDAATPGGAIIAGLRHPAAVRHAGRRPTGPAPSKGPGPTTTPATATPQPSTTPATATPQPSTTPIVTKPATGIPATGTKRGSTGARASGRRSTADPPIPGAMPSAQTVSAKRIPASGSHQAARSTSRTARPPARKYQQHIPPAVRNAFVTTARAPLMREQDMYQDVASNTGIRWEVLASCDWMQCRARPGYSPVYGEKLGSTNPGGTIYRTRSAALEQCADDLVELGWAVYGIDLRARKNLSVRELANVFAAFRWGALLKLHHTSAMEFPYSVAGLTERHLNMRWPDIAEPTAPDKPGSRFRMPFGAVPVVLSLNYPATA